MYFFVVKYKVQIITGLRAMFESGYFSSVQSTTEQEKKEDKKEEGKTGRTKKTGRKKARQRQQRRQKGRAKDRTKKTERKKTRQKEHLKDDGESGGSACLLLSAVGVWCAVPHCVSVCPSWCQRRRDGSVPTDQ